jgi:hypothetical protein
MEYTDNGDNDVIAAMRLLMLEGGSLRAGIQPHPFLRNTYKLLKKSKQKSRLP